MKAILILGGLGLAVIGGMAFVPNVQESLKETIEIEKEVTPDWASDADAVKAAQDVIRRKEIEAENAEIQKQIEALETRQAEIEKELGF